MSLNRHSLSAWATRYIEWRMDDGRTATEAINDMLRHLGNLAEKVTVAITSPEPGTITIEIDAGHDDVDSLTI